MPEVELHTLAGGEVRWNDGYGALFSLKDAAEESNRVHKADHLVADAARNAEVLAAYRQAAPEIHNAEIVAAGLDKPGDWAGHPTPPMLEDADIRRLAELDRRVAADAAWKAEQESGLGVRQIPKDQLPKLAGLKCWDDGFRILFPTKDSAECSNIVKTRMVAARKAEYDALLDDVKKALRKKREVDLVRDARKLHDKIGRTLDPVAGKPLQFHKAYAAFALALLDLLEDVR